MHLFERSVGGLLSYPTLSGISIPITFPLHYPYITIILPLHYHYTTITLVLHYHYISFTLPLHYNRITITLPKHYHCITIALPLHYHCVPIGNGNGIFGKSVWGDYSYIINQLCLTMQLPSLAASCWWTFNFEMLDRIWVDGKKHFRKQWANWWVGQRALQKMLAHQESAPLHATRPGPVSWQRFSHTCTESLNLNSSGAIIYI